MDTVWVLTTREENSNSTAADATVYSNLDLVIETLAESLLEDFNEMREASPDLADHAIEAIPQIVATLVNTGESYDEYNECWYGLFERPVFETKEQNADWVQEQEDRMRNRR